MYINQEISKEIESCIANSHHSVTKVTSGSDTLSLSTGGAFYLGPDAFLSQVVGWGFYPDLTTLKNELDDIEQFYKAHDCSINIELSPYVNPGLLSVFKEKQFSVEELNTISYLEFSDEEVNFNSQFNSNGKSFTIRSVDESSLSEWAQIVAIGFDAADVEEQFLQYAQAEAITAYAAFHEENMVAGATLSVHESVCDLGVTSTLPIFRGHGLQKALLLARLQDAQHQQIRLASVTTEPGSISEQNIQKIGFKPAYTRLKLVL